MKPHSLAACAITLTMAFLSTTPPHVYARGGGRGGFSRESPAAGGSFSSRSGAMEGQQRGAQASRQQYASNAQASRQQYGSNAQASRQQAVSNAQSNREQAAKNLQSNAQQYRGSYPYNNWDAGTGIAAAAAIGATGAAVGAIAANNSAGSVSSGTLASAMTPCASPNVISANGVQYFNCGGLWYTQAYGPSGPTYAQVPAPPGY